MQSVVFFFFNDTSTAEIYTLSLHDALPISVDRVCVSSFSDKRLAAMRREIGPGLCTSAGPRERSEEHTSELQSHVNLVCRLLLEKKKKKKFVITSLLLTLVLYGFISHTHI